MFDTSGGSEQDRRDEARRLIEIITTSDVEHFSQKEIDFIHDLEDRFDRFGENAKISPKQLFWLRDLKDKAI